MLRIAICDDDAHFTGELDTLLHKKATFMNLQLETEVYFDGLTIENKILKGSRFDLIFLDIEMEKVNGIEAARHIREIDKAVLLIYISCYEQYLKELFEVEPFRFLSKPLDYNQFYRYFSEACQRIGEAEFYFQFQFNKEIKKVLLRDIIYFESRNRVIHIFIKGGIEECFYGKLNAIENDLLKSKQTFLRIHQSFLVNYTYVAKINYSNMILVTGKGKKICLKISEDRQKLIRIQLGELAAGKAVIV